jgi:hypothetical protein
MGDTSILFNQEQKLRRDRACPYGEIPLLSRSDISVALAVLEYVNPIDALCINPSEQQDKQTG